ncbi:MAG: hypothetical protein LBV43_04780 [Prevotella sp.]|jgi:hypothetical protein|nr:hypothetical protein [Prevotella sp.]
MERKITVLGVIQEGVGIGLKNALSLIGAVVLWLVTIWVPYINVGTTIAILTIPIELSKGGVISPLFIFDGKYRQYMGEFFTLIGLMMLSIMPALFFMVIPAYIIAIGWSLAIYILLDKGIAPGEALVQSNKATNGYKWTIFGVGLVLGLAFLILSWVFGLLGAVGSILVFLLLIVYQVIALGCNAVIYRNLVLGNTDQTTIE